MDWQRHTTTWDDQRKHCHFVRNVEIRKRVLGPEHPDTLQSMDGLAATFFRLGRSMEGLKLWEECMQIRKRVLGPEHPDTLQSMDGLAATFLTQLQPFHRSSKAKEC